MKHFLLIVTAMSFLGQGLRADFILTYTTIPIPVTLPQPFGQMNDNLFVNDLGQITGNYQDANGNDHPFFRSANGQVTFLATPPGVNSIEVNGITDSGEIVGKAVTSTFVEGFRYVNGVYSFFTDPSAVTPGQFYLSSLKAISSDGKSALDQYQPGLVAQTHWSIVDSSNNITNAVTANVFNLFGINNTGEMAGVYLSGGLEHGIILEPGGTFRTVDPFAGFDTYLLGINDKGQVVGNTAYGSGSFIWDPTNGATLLQQGYHATSINNNGEIAGYVTNGATLIGYFTANYSVVPEPSSLALLGFGGIGCAVSAYRRRRKQPV